MEKEERVEIKEIKKNQKAHKKINSRVIIGIIVVIIAVIAALVVTKFVGSNNQDEIEKNLTEMGRDFYENFYYEQIGTSSDERSTLLSKFTDVGIKIDLDNLGRYNNGEFKDKINDLKNKKTGEKCNKTNTRVIITPKSPYGKTDYTIKAELDCGFDEKKEK